MSSCHSVGMITEYEFSWLGMMTIYESPHFIRMITISTFIRMTTIYEFSSLHKNNSHIYFYKDDYYLWVSSLP